MNERLLIVGPYPPPYGGIASQIANTIPLLLKAGFERVHVLSAGRENAIKTEDRFIRETVDLRAQAAAVASPAKLARAVRAFTTLLGYRLPPRKALAETMRLALIIDRIDRHGYNIVHYFMVGDAVTAPLVRRLRPHVKLAMTVYGEIYEAEDFYKRCTPLVQDTLDVMDACMSSSKYCARSVETLGLSSAKIEPLYYGVDLERFSPRNDRAAFRDSTGIASDRKLVFFLGRLNDEMGADIVADMIPGALEANPDIVFVVAGADGPCVPRLRALEKQFDGRVRVHVNVPGGDIPKMYAACDLLLAPTRDRHACMGMSIKEAMASGRVGICSRSGGIPEAVVDGETGIMLPTADDLRVRPQDLATAIIDLCADDGRRAAMGHAARARAEAMFDNDKTAERLIQIYRTMLAA